MTDARRFYTERIPAQFNAALDAQAALGEAGRRVYEGMTAVNATLRIDVRGEGGGAFFLNIRNGRMTAEADAAQAPFLTLVQDLAAFERLAASGETVLVTDRGRVVAEINPPRPVPDRYKDHPVLARGIREGWITPARITDGSPPPRNPIPGYTLEQLLADLDRDREDRV